ncbi:hypothetical protein COCMIDRAFT_41342 [Bipolaris oryzae ATCC 44560]|uniref:DUF7587 domain-containing protein n=1 Tax=Bipolaris oryzae ATCC 44560 TaxID=930090 RepID=W6YXP3_COCMI|nr:uncharacterized protein COCMIDRAFT_41342 [Bipolaris oryzae ATCC 44560]EUC40319.1 hypothetical protein COCMIDRAFT_41342 [Bipolaris oryzae ATCC 44560]
MATSSDELAGKLGAMSIAGDEDRKHVDGNVPLVDSYIDVPEGDSWDSVQHATEGVYERIQNASVECSKMIAFSDEQSFIQLFLRFFKGDIEKIIQKSFHDARARALSWKVAEKCYKEAMSPSGILNVGRYFNDSKNSQSRRRVDSISGNQHHVFDNEGERQWIEFWVTVLNLSTGGPTLFYPRTSEDIDLSNPDTIPPYLFRVFDKKSSGKNNKKVMASSGYTSQVQSSGVNDLLSMEDSEATKLLYYHIGKKRTRTNDHQDCLLSWTSSLLYAVQYATYRQHRLDLSYTDIEICMVKTSQFLQGQFVRDIELLNKYYPNAEYLGGKIRGLFDLRLNRQEYYNGEYFSQGVVNHSGRSCVVSLEQLEVAGIFKLYPELKDPRDSGGRILNANRVCDLREKWSLQRTTTNEEISCAFRIAQCFDGFDKRKIACILLAFKCRGLSDKIKLDTNRAPSWAEKPVEVSRYWQALEILSHLEEDPGRMTYLPRDIYKVTRLI